MTLVAHSKVMQRLLQKAARIAATDEPVLILGETGTGKEMLARWIHAHSTRDNRPFLPLNCTALPSTLIESELFGYRKGAFTDARQDKAGLFEAVQGGTIFLDEIGELPHNVQVKLLRVLDTREILPLGAREPIHVDFRLIAATHQEIHELRDEGRFREDLYYRIGVFVLRLPPLRERLEELPLLALMFAREVRSNAQISPEVIERLMCYHWPGNIRELRNVVHHAAVLAESGIIYIDHLPEWFLEKIDQIEQERNKSLKSAVRVFETKILQAYLDACKGDVQRALKMLGVARSSFYRKLRRSSLSSQN